VDLRLHDQSGGTVAPRVVRLRCPRCHHNARLEPLAETPDHRLSVVVGTGGGAYQPDVGVGLRFCPEETCAQLIYVVYRIDSEDVILTLPAESLDFDSTNLPDSVLNALSEAATCFTNGCYVASAIMIRKTLEEVCHDRGVTGDNLKEKVAALGSSVVVPQALLNGLDNLRLLGNDAAHIESQTFNQIGKEEVDVSFEVVKEFLKAVYQYDSLIKRLDALKQHQQQS
jgi:Domain of unknown function (DUF4145)